MRAHNFKDLSGKRFGHLVALSPIKKQNSKTRAYSWICKCDCNSEAIVDTGHLSSGHTKSCGCARLDKVRKESGLSALRRVLKNYKLKAKERNLYWELSDEQFILLTSGVCYYCGALPGNKCAPSANGCFIYNGIDRKNNLIGYVWGNVVPSCKICNIAKHTLTQEEFLSWANRVVNHFKGSGDLHELDARTIQ